MHEGRGYRYTFQRARVASSPEVPKVTWWKIATFLGYHLHWLTSLETSRHFRKIALRLGIFLAMFRDLLGVVARQLAPKCRDFCKVAKLARQCKWPYRHGLTYPVAQGIPQVCSVPRHLLNGVSFNGYCWYTLHSRPHTLIDFLLNIKICTANQKLPLFKKFLLIRIEFN